METLAVPARLQVEDLLLDWKDVFENRKPEYLLRYYHPDAVLWGAFSDRMRATPNQILDYYKKLFEADHLKIFFCDQHIFLAGDTAIADGVMRMEFDHNSEHEVHIFRYSFSLIKTGKGWLIINQHTSAFPGKKGFEFLN